MTGTIIMITLRWSTAEHAFCETRRQRSHCKITSKRIVVDAATASGQLTFDRSTGRCLSTLCHMTIKEVLLATLTED